MINRLDTIKNTLLSGRNPIKKTRVYGIDNVNLYRLVVAVRVQLSNGDVIKIPRHYVWDLASVPRLLWWLCPPDSDAELAFLIHDYLYEKKMYNRQFVDNEMLKWSVITNGTRKLSLRNIDNYIRYYIVRLAGRHAWNN
ncbi:DUF1353 domain-containing protein [Flavobacterium branchiophilum]|uniref:DUF1353 domain-containing protein n=1 Tax=Flavobacterium branchiophilum TaxID=55197 RepID=A0A2H3KE93_9FLAO|nr:DUF1353 domain-containing protein [Flavobacterium branchiophilum]PDS26487.1 hypothetical protein B0A77_02405 [Flavobacterium branchiophilum]